MAAPRAAVRTAFRFAGIQMAVTSSKSQNLSHASQLIRQAAAKNDSKQHQSVSHRAPSVPSHGQGGADIVCLPECFNSPYGTQYFDEYAENNVETGETAQMLSEAARDCQIVLIGGSLPERDAQGKLYNTSLVFGPDGSLLAKHRKMHLFDINVPGGIKFRESDVLSAGDAITTVETSHGKLGVAICYDIRFPELAQIMAQDRGCDMLVYPGAFNMTTGPAHWELLARARAVDNQVFVAVVSPARDESATYRAWGHTSIISPWGEVLATTDEKESIVFADVDLTKCDDMRTAIPVRQQKRHEVYDSPHAKA